MVRQYNFTERVRQALSAARVEANRVGSEYVGTEHLLLGLLVLSDDNLDAVFAMLGVTRATAFGALEGRLSHGQPRAAGADLPYTSTAKRVLEAAMDEASALRHDAVDVEHLLLGLTSQPGTVAATALAEVRIDRARLTPVIQALWPPPRPRRTWFGRWLRG